MVTKIYQMKMQADAANIRQGKHRVPMGDYVVIWFDNNYGLRKVAQQNLLRFIFSLQKLYSEGKDLRACQFVRLCGLFHPLPNVCCDFLLESVEIIAGCMSGSGQPFRTPELFWGHWCSGKVLSVPPIEQLEALTYIFQREISGPQLQARLKKEIAANPESVPSYVTLEAGSISMSRFTSFIVTVMLELNNKQHDDIVKTFRVASGADKMLQFSEFQKAVETVKPLVLPVEGSSAYMFYRACNMADLPAKEVLNVIQNYKKFLSTVEDSSANVDDAAQVFLRDHGWYNTPGVRSDGTSALEEFRRAKEGKGKRE